MVTARTVLRPQLGFKDLIDNSSSSPFMPRLREKPNARRPMSVLPEYDEDGVTIVAYTHPYLHEMEVFR